MRLFRVIPLAALVLAGCAGGPDLSGDQYPSDIARTGTLAAVTTRKPVGDGRVSPWFGTERGNPHIAEVRFDSPYKAGRFSTQAIGLSDWKIRSVQQVASIAAAQPLDGASQRDVLIYVHGFNESFADATLDAARLSDALHFRGNTVVFSWPSRNSVLDYMADRESALWSRDALEDTIDDLLSAPGVGRVNIVAHSMGGMVTVEALRQVVAHNGATGKLGAIIFASPDIDVDGFSASVRRMGDLNRRMTVITSRDDRALAISASLAGGGRAGRVDKARLEELGIEVVDASGLSRGLIRHDLFLHDASVQKVIAQAIHNAGSQVSLGTVSSYSAPPVTPATPVAQPPAQYPPPPPVQPTVQPQPPMAQVQPPVEVAPSVEASPIPTQ